MLELPELILLTLLYILSLSAVLYLLQQDVKQQGFSFHLLFSLVYLSVFYLGFPLSMGLMYGFHISLPPFAVLCQTLLTATGFYLLYYWVYQGKFYPRLLPEKREKNTPQLTAKITMWILLAVSLGAMVVFYGLNGLLLFKLTAYNQIFSAQVSAVALKRFFYFCLPALLIFYFLQPSKRRWWQFLCLGVAFGVLSYLVIGGTRANLALAVALFVLIGIAQGYISMFALVMLAILGIFAMFLLAMWRYGLVFNDEQTLFRFLHLTRDTFSPWENLATILNTKNIEYQGLMPIIRDFYVYIPKALWADRPDLVLNTANYFTWDIKHYYAGLAISPTLIGSFYIMGSYPMILVGAVGSALVVKGFDGFYRWAKDDESAVLKAYCFSHIFTLTVLVREGFDAFVSRFVFLTIGWGVAYGLAKGIVKWKKSSFEK
ncbi:WzyE family oligosaccharide polymerase [Lonepinella sp. BR2930]|uniref:WzyE family oligosaccharide polymerase n=1 Tax=Lonepinella sp. BR2930 TaxID=3434554 RepID=UPI003F6E207F